MWTEAYQWVKLRKEVKHDTATDGTKTSFVCATGNDEPISEIMVQQYKDAEEGLNWDSFDDLKRWRFSMWKISLKPDEWDMAVCSCPIFLKRHICKHTVGVAIRLQCDGCVVPREAKMLTPLAKRKPGRPSKARGAVIRQ